MDYRAIDQTVDVAEQANQHKHESLNVFESLKEVDGLDEKQEVEGHTYLQAIGSLEVLDLM